MFRLFLLNKTSGLFCLLAVFQKHPIFGVYINETIWQEYREKSRISVLITTCWQKKLQTMGINLAFFSEIKAKLMGSLIAHEMDEMSN